MYIVISDGHSAHIPNHIFVKLTCKKVLFLRSFLQDWVHSIFEGILNSVKCDTLPLIYAVLHYISGSQ